VLVVESFNQKTGVSEIEIVLLCNFNFHSFKLGSRLGTWLLERQLTPKYSYMGTTKEGCGGLWEQIFYQGLDPQCMRVFLIATSLPVHDFITSFTAIIRRIKQFLQ